MRFRAKRETDLFPNRESWLRLVTALGVETSDPKNPGLEWLSGKRYLDMSLLVDPAELEEFIPA